MSIARVQIVDPFVEGHHSGYNSGLLRELTRRGITVDPVVTLNRPPTFREWAGMSIWDRLISYRRLVRCCNDDGRSVRVWTSAELLLTPMATTMARRPREVAILHQDFIFVSPARRLILHTIRGFGAVVVHPTELYERLLSCGVTCIHAGIPTADRLRLSRMDARRRLGIRSQQVVLTIGQVRGDKGIQQMVAVWDHISPAIGRNVLWVIAGRDLMGLNRLARTTVRYDLHELSEEEMDTYLSAADVVVLPYPQSTALSGIVALACSHGVPVCAMDVGELGRTVREQDIGAVWPSGDWGAMAIHLRGLLQAEPARAQCIRANQERFAAASGWDTSPIIEAIVELLRKNRRTAAGL